MTKRRRILLTNDDGIDAPGLRALLGPLSRLGEVTVVAPVEECSGVSHSIVYLRSVVCETRDLDGVAAFAIDAYPADCVKLAIDQLMTDKPDLVVSGINKGANIGAHIFYSGTVAAALEASMMGVTGLAVSLSVSSRGGLIAGEDDVSRLDFGRAAGVFDDVLRMLDGLDLGEAPALNINIPPHEVEIRGIRWASQYAGAMPDQYRRAAGEEGRHVYRMQMVDLGHEPEEESDRTLLEAGFVTVTPLTCNLTCRETLSRLDRAGRLRATFKPSEPEGKEA